MVRPDPQTGLSQNIAFRVALGIAYSRLSQKGFHAGGGWSPWLDRCFVIWPREC